jgi:hypothetical protein
MPNSSARRAGVVDKTCTFVLQYEREVQSHCARSPA